MKKLLIISSLLSPFCILNYSRPYQNGRQESGWQVIASGRSNDLQSIHFTYTGIGYSCGNSGIILKSIDEEISWSQITTPTSIKLNDIFVFDQNVDLAVDTDGIILRTTTGGKPATLVDIDYSPVYDFKLSQIYPNPFNPNTKIRFTIPELRFTILKVYDVLGNEVATLVNEELTAGEYEVEFSSHSRKSGNLVSGIYFYQLRAGSFIQTKKMILIK